MKAWNATQMCKVRIKLIQLYSFVTSQVSSGGNRTGPVGPSICLCFHVSVSKWALSWLNKQRYHDIIYYHSTTSRDMPWCHGTTSVGWKGYEIHDAGGAWMLGHFIMLVNGLFYQWRAFSFASSSDKYLWFSYCILWMLDYTL